MASKWNDSNMRRDIDGTKRRHYHAVMHRISKDSKRQ